jgi:hypothetical protein
VQREPDPVYERSWAVIYAYAHEHPDTFGGCWVPDRRDPGCHVAFTADVEAHRAALAELLPDRRLLFVHQVERTAAELGALMRRVCDDFDEEEDVNGILAPAIELDHAANSVHMQIEADDREAAVSYLTDRYGPGLRVTWVGRPGESAF